MYQHITLFIAFRYMFGRTLDRFARFVSWLSTIGIIFGVMALVTVLSVMNGFESNLEKSILNLIPQALITCKDGSINPKKRTALDLKDLYGVRHITPLTTSDIVLQSAVSVAVGIMLGIEPNEWDPLTPYLIHIKQKQLKPNHYNIIIGEQLARRLDVKRGDLLRLTVLSVSQHTPIGRIPSQRLFTVIGTFRANSEVDSYQVLINQQDASRLMRYPIGHITGWRLFLKEPLRVHKFSQQVLPKEMQWKDWRERKGDLFQAVRMEKTIMGLLLSLIIAVAAFNIVTSLGLMVMEKHNEIAILQAQGLTCGKIMAVFMIQGASAGIIGSLIGALLGLFLTTHLSILMPVLHVLIDSATLPVEINFLQVTTIVLASMIVSLLSTIYPSWHATRIHLDKAFRYE